MRLGVAAALVDGEVVPGDVEIDTATGRVAAIGAAPRGPRGGVGIAVAGLVDLQVNGLDEIDLRSTDPDGVVEVSRRLAAAGVTAFQPTLHSQSVEDYHRSLGVLRAVRDRYRDEPVPGAEVLPAHLEGPFLSPRWAGAHDPATLLAPDPEVLEALLEAGPVGFVTLAPELPGAHRLIEQLADAGVVVSIGHSDATAEQTRDAVDAGARHLTHCWNAHRRFEARDPGPAGAALALDAVTVGVVGDLAHVAPDALTLTMRAAAGRVAATADSVAVGPGATVRDGAVRDPHGVLRGGAARQDDCLRNLVGLGFDLAEALDACGGAQRRLLGLPAVRLRPGDPADVVVLDDALTPRRTLVGGAERWCT